MKKNKEKIIQIGLAIFVVCLIIFLGYLAIKNSCIYYPPCSIGDLI